MHNTLKMCEHTHMYVLRTRVFVYNCTRVHKYQVGELKSALEMLGITKDVSYAPFLCPIFQKGST